MTKSDFGEHLKRERELRGVSLDEICAATRISTRFLEALESEEWEQLPGGVFNRGFVRAVARYLGLDEEGTVAEYVMAVNQGAATPATSTQIEPRQLQKQDRSKLPKWGLVAAALLLVLVAGWLGIRFFATHGSRAAPEGGESSAASPSEPAASTATSPAPSGADPLTPGGNTPAETDKLVLKIEAGKATSATVTADGQAVFGGTFIAGQSRTFQAENQFDVSADDAGALLLQLNNQTLAPIGPPGQPGKVSLTRRNLKPSPGGND